MSRRSRNKSTAFKVGLLVLASLLVLAFAVFLIGEQNSLFRSMNSYTVQLANVSGLQAGNPVQLNGVGVGRVTSIELSPDPMDRNLTVGLSIDDRYAERIREDSYAKIKTLGLLGDKFIEITSGSTDAAVVPTGGEIGAAPATNVDELISSGEDAMENVVAISASLTKILARLESGDSVLGQFLEPLPETGGQGPSIVESLIGSLESVDAVLTRLNEDLDTGRGPVARFLSDERMGAQLSRSVGRLDQLTATLETGEGMLPTLLNDPETARSMQRTLSNLEQSSARLGAVAERFETSNGLAAKLLTDEEYAEDVTQRIESVLERLDSVATAISSAEGTAGKLIYDPALYDAVEDVIVGVDESRMLRWLIRNRQKKGIKERFEAETAAAEAAGRDVEREMEQIDLEEEGTFEDGQLVDDVPTDAQEDGR